MDNLEERMREARMPGQPFLYARDAATVARAAVAEAVAAERERHAPLVEAATAYIDDVTSDLKDYDLDPLERGIATALSALEGEPGAAVLHAEPCRYCGNDGSTGHVYGERKCCPDCDHRREGEQ